VSIRFFRVWWWVSKGDCLQGITRCQPDPSAGGTTRAEPSGRRGLHRSARCRDSWAAGAAWIRRVHGLFKARPSREGIRQLRAGIPKVVFIQIRSQKHDQARFQGAVCLTSARLSTPDAAGVHGNPAGEGSRIGREEPQQLRGVAARSSSPHRAENPATATSRRSLELGRSANEDLLRPIDHQQALGAQGKASSPPAPDRPKGQGNHERLLLAGCPGVGWCAAHLEFQHAPAPSSALDPSTG